MTSEIRFFVPGRPVPKQRHRTVKGRKYTPPETVAYARLVRLIANTAWPKPWPLDRRYGVEVVVTPADGRVGDGDNYQKAATDPLKGLAWKDDRQVKRWECEVLDPDSERPGMHVRVWVR